MASQQRSAKSGSRRFHVPAVLCLLVGIALLLFANLHKQIGDHVGISHVPKLRVGFDLGLPPAAEKTRTWATQVQDRRTAAKAQAEAALPLKQVVEEPKLPAVSDSFNEEKAVVLQKKVMTTSSPDPYIWQLHSSKSCQNYANDDSTARSLEASKMACVANTACVAIECPHGEVVQCTLRAVANMVDYAASDCYNKVEKPETGFPSSKLHPAYNSLLRHYSFQQVTTQSGQRVNVILVRAPFRSPTELELLKKYKDQILFMGISSFEDYPLDAMNPFSRRFPKDQYTGIFEGWLHMMRDPENWFPPHVKTLLMSQSDFSLPDYPARDYSIPRKYDFTLSGSDQDVWNDCVGWSSYAKNWSFVKESLAVMCGEYNLKGVLVATKSKDGRKACSIPDSCKHMIQTVYLDQNKYFDYLRQSRFAYLPQVHDASPRVSTQALSLDVPLLMNAHISGGWKYLNEKTGEFFHDMSDFRKSLEKILKNADIPYHYEPRKWVKEHYGNSNSGPRLFKFVKENFAHRVKLPKNTRALLT